MDFDFTEEQKMLKGSVREFLDKEITPIADERDRKGPLTREETIYFIKKLMPFGYYHGILPNEYGGLGLDYKTYGLLYEELAYSWAGLAGTINLAEVRFLPFFTEEMRKRLIPRVAAGELIACHAITEPGAGSNAADIQTTATLDGNHYIINGVKTWISDGSIADICVLFATTDRTKGPLGLSIFVVEKDTSPFQARNLLKIGLHAWPTSELVFDDCRIPKENNLLLSLLGDSSGDSMVNAYTTLMQVFDVVRPLWALHSVGIAQAAIDASVNYAKERIQFGKLIGSFQLVQSMIYDMVVQTEAARLLAYRAMDMIEKGEKCRKESSMAKAYATEAAVGVTSKAIEIHGAYGLSQDLPLERYYRDARVWTIPDGTTEIQKLIVGREILKIRAYT